MHFLALLFIFFGIFSIFLQHEKVVLYRTPHKMQSYTPFKYFSLCVTVICIFQGVKLVFLVDIQFNVDIICSKLVFDLVETIGGQNH